MYKYVAKKKPRLREFWEIHVKQSQAGFSSGGLFRALDVPVFSGSPKVGFYKSHFPEFLGCLLGKHVNAQWRDCSRKTGNGHSPLPYPFTAQFSVCSIAQNMSHSQEAHLDSSTTRPLPLVTSCYFTLRQKALHFRFF